MRRAVSLTLGIGLLLAACGTVPSPGAGPTSTGPGPVATTGPTLTTVVTSPGTTTVAPTTTTTLAPGTTSPSPTSTTSTVATPATTVPRPDVVVVPYFYLDEAGHPDRPGPFLVPMTREVPATKAVAAAAVEQLLAGPTREEADSVPAVSTAVPDGTRLLGLTISDGVATIDLSSAFEAGDDSAAVSARIAQVVFTLSRYPSVQEVLFRQEGVELAVPTGSGQLVSRPVNIGDYLEHAAALHVEGPSYRGQGANPLHVTGFGAVFEASFQYALTDDDGLIISEGQAMTNNGTGWGGFDFAIDYEVDREQVGALIVWAHSAQDGAQIDVREYPVTLVP